MSKTKKMKADQSILNPCLKEHESTLKCFDDNNYDKEKCIKHIENYTLCKKFWGYVQMQRRKDGITPYLPAVEDREKVKEEYVNKFKNL